MSIFKTIIILIALFTTNLFNITGLTAASANISATAAIVIDAQTGFILYEKNIHEPRYPASIAKVMTALIALEQYGTRLYEPITFSANAVYSIPSNYSHIAMDEGETLTMEDALYGLMLASANEVANAIAEHISEDIQSFAELMTRRAAALGAHNTVFRNPGGLHDPQQVTTAYDMAIITREAMRHPKFVQLISTVRHDILPTERQPQVRELINSNRFIRSGQHFNENVVGGKTGFTTPAGHTLVTYAVRDERELIIVTLEGAGSHLYTDTQELMRYGFGLPYEESRLFYRGQYAKTVPVYGGRSRENTLHGEIKLIVPQDVYLTLPQGFEISEVEYQVYTPPRLTTPIQAGQNIGRIVYNIRGITVGDVILRAGNTVLAPTYVEEMEEAESLYVTEAYSYPDIFTLENLLENYYLSFLLPLGIFVVGLMLSISVLRGHHNKKQARLGRHPMTRR